VHNFYTAFEQTVAEHPQPQWPSGVSTQKAYIFVDGDTISAATSRTEFWPELTSTEAAVVDIVVKLSLLTAASAAILSASAAVADVDTYIFSEVNEVNATQVQMPMQEPLLEIIRGSKPKSSEMGGFDASFDSRYRLLINMGQAMRASTLQASY
jgi:hypothetical protein